MPKLLFKGDAAVRIGLREWQLQRLRERGLVPEAVKVGRYFLFPEDQLLLIRDRLVLQGHIRPAESREAVHAG